MEETNHTERKEGYSKVLSKVHMVMLKNYGIFDESPIVIAISPVNKENFINVDVANQLQILESIIRRTSGTNNK